MRFKVNITSFHAFYAVYLLFFPLFAFSMTTYQLDFKNTNLSLFDSTGPQTYNVKIPKPNGKSINDVLSDSNIQFIDSSIPNFPPDGLNPNRPYKISSFQSASGGGRIFTDFNYYPMYVYLQEFNPNLETEYNVFVSSAPIPFVQTPQNDQLKITAPVCTSFSPVWETGRVKATIQSSETEITVTINFVQWGAADKYYRLVRKSIGFYYGG